MPNLNFNEDFLFVVDFSPWQQFPFSDNKLRRSKYRNTKNAAKRNSGYGLKIQKD